MKIAITGGAGFIGTSLAWQLKQAGHEITLLDLKLSQEFPEDSKIVDILDEAALKSAMQGIDVIYHLAAEHRDDVQPVQKYYDVNVTGAQNLVDAADENGIKTIIFTSSVAVYGLDAGDSNKGSCETDMPGPFNDYGQSKLQAEKIFEQWLARDPVRNLVTVRLVATFGPGNRGNIYTLIDQIIARKFIMIGNGINRKSIAYVENVADFLVFCMNLGHKGHVYNYADKPDLSVRDLVQQIRECAGYKGLGPRAPYAAGMLGGAVFDIAAKITGRSFPISTIRIKKFCANTIVNADRAAATGFTAKYSLHDGLEKMIASDFANITPAQNKAA
jgi:nucleoside-diphosphate-sugar epimerase